jgi:recombination endonuclease VII
MATISVISKEEAIKKGLRRFFTGVPCKYGHIAERIANPSQECCECKRLRANRFYARKSEDIKQKVRSYRQANLEKVRERYRKWVSLNKDLKRKLDKARYESNKDYQRDYELTRNYGISTEDYDNILAAQNGVCAICLQTCSSGKRLAVDHCHKTGSVRGLLCVKCNTTLGRMNDDPENFHRAAEYLEKGGTTDANN